MAPGNLIVLEGIDGSGTTTQAQLVAQALRQRGEEVLVEAEPTTGDIGRLIRQRLRDGRVPWAVMALLFAADRQEHSQLTLSPALVRGASVVCDRYHLSTLCYQLASCEHEAHAAGMEMASQFVRQEYEIQSWLRALASYCEVPDYTILLRVSVDTALERLTQRSPERDAYERRDLLERVAAHYEDALTRSPKIHCVNGEQLPSEVTADILAVLR